MTEPYAMLEEFNYIGKRGVRRIDGYAKVSGEAKYTRDVAFPGMLYGKIFTSPYAHAKIKSMDTSTAEAYPGVRAILRYDDPELGEKSYQIPLYQYLTFDYPLEGIAHAEGHGMGFVVCADSEEICEEALKLVEIEWEQLPFILDHKDALEPGAPLLWPDLNPEDNIDRYGHQEAGDIEAGFAEADKIIEFTSFRADNTVAGVEPNSCVAVWKGDQCDVWLHDQCPYETQYYLSKWVPMNKLQVHCPYNGSFFGLQPWKSYPHLFPILAVLLAQRTRRPVKVMQENSNFWGIGDELGYYDFKIGCKNDGTITAVKVDTIASRAPLGKLQHGTKIPNSYSDNYHPYVNRGPWGCWRHGSCDCAAFTLVFDHVAGELGLDPTEVALKNDGCDGVAMADLADYKLEHGFSDRWSLKECIDAGKAAIDWDNKWHAPGTKTLPNGKMHGIGFTHTVEWSHSPTAGAIVGVFIKSDGTVNILSRHTDFGCLNETTNCQIAADELGMRVEDVYQIPEYDAVGDSQEAGGSSGMITNAAALVPAAREVKRQLLEMAVIPPPYAWPAPGSDTFFPGLKPEDLGIKDSEIFEKANPSNKFPVAEVVGAFWERNVYTLTHMPVVAYSWAPKYIDIEMHIMARQAHFIEVEVDPETGDIEITNVVCVNDVGRVVSPETVEGQQYGGAHMGISRSGFEQGFYDPQTGVRLNDNQITYTWTTMLDVAGGRPIKCIAVETAQGYAPYGMYGIGENIGACMTSIHSYAVYNAIGQWVNDYPITPEKVLKVLGKA